MKKIIISTAFIMISILTVNVLDAQKVYATKTGQIFFNATGGLEKIAAVNNQVDSKFVDATGQIIFGVLIKGFKFQNQLMEDHFNENYMESTQFPKADFKGYILNIKEVNFTKDGEYPIQVEGALSIHGVSQKVSTKGTLSLKQGKASIEGDFSVKIKDYGIKGLYLGEKIANDAVIKLNCQY
ncbi:MAG: YceI family protein [Bacteroidetes bacterium]|nr:YceI family protein [Bacteroidota bacterium]